MRCEEIEDIACLRKARVGGRGKRRGFGPPAAERTLSRLSVRCGKRASMRTVHGVTRPLFPPPYSPVLEDPSICEWDGGFSGGYHQVGKLGST